MTAGNSVGACPGYCGASGACCRQSLQPELAECGFGTLGCEGFHCCTVSALAQPEPEPELPTPPPSALSSPPPLSASPSPPATPAPPPAILREGEACWTGCGSVGACP